MIEYSFRFNVKEGREAAFHDFVAESKESLQSYDRKGWRYKGLYCNVYDLGSGPGYEIRFQLDNFAALDSPFDPASHITVSQLLKYVADLPQPEARLQKPIDEVIRIDPW